MQLIDVTNSYARKIRRELMNTPVHFIKVFTLGNSKVVFKKKNDDAEIIISNKLRPITEKEIDFVKEHLLGEKAKQALITARKNITEISLKRHK